jgi:hypothetical protein
LFQQGISKMNGSIPGKIKGALIILNKIYWKVNRTDADKIIAECNDIPEFSEHGSFIFSEYCPSTGSGTG